MNEDCYQVVNKQAGNKKVEISPDHINTRIPCFRIIGKVSQAHTKYCHSIFSSQSPHKGSSRHGEPEAGIWTVKMSYKMGQKK